jgi:hypothetical protein
MGSSMSLHDPAIWGGCGGEDVPISPVPAQSWPLSWMSASRTGLRRNQRWHAQSGPARRLSVDREVAERDSRRAHRERIDDSAWL